MTSANSVFLKEYADLYQKLISVYTQGNRASGNKVQIPVGGQSFSNDP